MLICFRYSDVFHEVLPVTEGFRLVLTYNLILVPDDEESISRSITVQAAKDHLITAMNAWKSAITSNESNIPKFFVHRLEHQYTQASLGFPYLKGSDRTQVECLQEVASKSGAEIFLATLEREVTTEDGESFDPYCCEEVDSELSEDANDPNESDIKATKEREVINSTWNLKHVNDLDGFLVGRGILLSRSHVLNVENLNDESPDDEEHSGFTGNEGCTATYWYRSTVSSTDTET
jgi:hypothetical protein